MPRLNNQEVTNLEIQGDITLLTSVLAGFLVVTFGSYGMYVEVLHPAETQHCHLEIVDINPRFECTHCVDFLTRFEKAGGILRPSEEIRPTS